MGSEALWLPQENHASVKLDSNVSWIKTYNENRIKLQNP